MFTFLSRAKSEPSRILPVISCMLLAILGMGSGQAARATAEYAQKEGRACQYCHVSGSPGTIDDKTGRRETLDVNKRGAYYQAHNHSFDGYVEPRVRPNAPAALFRFVAREMLPDTARRIAVADVAGDHVPRLITLNVKPDTRDSSVLTVKKWDGKAYVTEFTGDTPGSAEKLAAGKFTTDGKIRNCDRTLRMAMERQNLYSQGRRAVFEHCGQRPPENGQYGARTGGEFANRYEGVPA